MNVKIEPSVARGTVDAPPSKSMAHRALICGALSGGSVISNISYSKDISATLDCLEAMGAKVEKKDNTLIIGGLDPFAVPDGAHLICNESGSTLRFFIPLCLLSDSVKRLSGSERLFERPLTVYEDICRQNGLIFEREGSSVNVGGRLKGGEYYVPGNISSQFITGLLFALPMADGDSVLTVTGRFESASYIDLTLSVLKDFGIEIKRQENVFYIRGGQKYSSNDYTVEGDCSNAAFLEAFNVVGGCVGVNGVRADTLQGDRVYYSMMQGLMHGEKKFDLSDCPDLAPVMFALAAYCGGASFSGTARLKIKESDRAAVMAEELGKLGIKVIVGDNTVDVCGGRLRKPEEMLCGHNDHRIVMALAVLCSVVGGEISGAEAISKSYPDFFDQIEALGIVLRR